MSRKKNKTKPKKSDIFDPMTKVDFIAHFECGGAAKIIEYFKEKTGFYPHQVRLAGFHLVDQFWSYNDEGEHGQATGPEDEMRPFNIVRIERISK